MVIAAETKFMEQCCISTKIGYEGVEIKGCQFLFYILVAVPVITLVRKIYLKVILKDFIFYYNHIFSNK